MTEAGGRRGPSNQANNIGEESCQFPFWYKDRLRYECVKRHGLSTSFRVGKYEKSGFFLLIITWFYNIEASRMKYVYFNISG